MATNSRYVDSLAIQAETTDVEVIVLGLSRTGTMSIYNALNKLGFKCYHMSVACAMAGEGHLVMWNEAITAKYGPYASAAAHYNSSDFAKLLQGYTALSDIPSVLFIPELLAAYPNARLILTSHPRGVDAWLRSFRNSFLRVGNWRVWNLLIAYDLAFSRPYMSLVRRIVEIWAGAPWPIARDFTLVEPRLRTFYTGHNDTVRELARKSDRKLLEFQAADGWAPLCEFVGKEIPAEPYPYYNKGDHVVNIHIFAVLMRLNATFGASVLRVMAILAVGSVAWWWMRQGT